MIIDSASLEICARITTMLLSVWCLVSTLEWAANFALFRVDGLLSWRVLSLRPDRVLRSNVGQRVFRERGMKTVLSARLLGALTLLVVRDPVLLSAALLLLVVTYWVISVRAWLGGDGSDQMGQIVSVGALFLTTGLSLHDEGIELAGVLLIAGQLTISYFVAGFSKLLSRTWRTGAAVAGVMDTHSYGHATAARIATRSKGVSFAVCWSVILGETFFPLTLLGPPNILMAVLFLFALFHLSNAFFMGLNAFVWSFTATYPSVIVFSGMLRQWLHIAN